MRDHSHTNNINININKNNEENIFHPKSKKLQLNYQIVFAAAAAASGTLAAYWFEENQYL